MPYPYNHESPQVDAVTAVLEEWFWSIEEGSAQHRFPDPDYVITRDWDQAKIDRIVEWALDEYYDTQVHSVDSTGKMNYLAGWASPGSSNINSPGATAGPDFKRLGTVQRLALAQDLDRTLNATQAAQDEYIKKMSAVVTYDE